MGYGTHSEYSLFGATYRKQALRETWRHFLDELYKRDPEGLRSCVGSSDWLETRNCFWRRWERGPSKGAHEVADGLWARVDRCKRENVEKECWKLLERLGRNRSDFVIYGFPEAAAFLDDPRYAELVREFQQLQTVHDNACRALDEAMGVLASGPCWCRGCSIPCARTSSHRCFSPHQGGVQEVH